MEIKFIVLIAYVIGIIFSIFKMEDFHQSKYRHRKIVKASYIFCWAALVVPGLNLIGASFLWWELRQAEGEQPAHFAMGMKLPEHYNCRSVRQPIAGLGEDDDHA